MKVDISILNAPLDNIKNYLDKINNLEYIHMDIMDGVFVPPVSFDERIVKICSDNFKKSFIDTHLMVNEPINYIKKYAKAGSDSITFHFECGKINEVIKEINKYNIKAGISIKPNTSVNEIKPYLKDIDMVLVMSVEPGYGGQKFIMDSINKVKELYKYRKDNNLNYMINIDGGINKETYSYIKDYCDLAVVGSAITKEINYDEVYNEYNLLFK